MKEIDKKLQEIAVNDWDKFVELIGSDRVIAAKACLLKQSGDTYGQISVKLDKPRQTIVSIIVRSCKDCR